MTLQISPFGITIIAVFYALSVGLLLLLARRLRDWKGRWFILAPLALVAIALPWADEIYIASRFAKLCEGAGVHVTRKVEVDGFFDQTTTGPSKPGRITSQQAIDVYEKNGYRFYERKTGDNVSHVEKVSGEWRITLLDRPTARYHYKRIVDYRDSEGIHYEKRVDHKIEMTGEVVIDSQTGEEIARKVQYMRYPGWVEHLWVRFFGSGQELCYGPLNEPDKQKRGLLYDYVLKPTNK